MIRNIAQAFVLLMVLLIVIAEVQRYDEIADAALVQ